MNSNMPRSGACIDIDLPLHFKASWCSGVDEAPYLVSPEVGHKDFPIKFERHMRIRRSISYRKRDDGGILLEVKGIIGYGGNERAIR